MYPLLNGVRGFLIHLPNPGSEALTRSPVRSLPREPSGFSPPPRASSGRAARWIALVFIFGMPLQGWGQDQSLLDYAREDPDRYVTADQCGECHVSEIEVWAKTSHSTGFKTMHQKDSAKTIAQKLGFKLIKRNSLCIRCHYTPVIKRGQLRALSGVSCESCHGAGRDFVDVHNNYGGKGVDAKTETPEHRAQRIEKSRQAGMRRPSDLYSVVESCFQCHLVPNEQLVNVGGHGSGGGNFEYVEWSQGEIRHNFLEALISDEQPENEERSAERKRLMYVVGRSVDLEYSLRGVAAATEKGIYLKAMTRQARVALGEVREIASRVRLPEIDSMQNVVRTVKVSLNNRNALLKAANKIAEATKTFVSKYDGTQLASLDPLILRVDEPPQEEIISTARIEEVFRAGPGEDDPVAVQPEESQEPKRRPAEASADRQVDVPSTPPSARSARTVVGKIKTRIRPASQHKTLGSGACNRCHGPQNKWWFDDPHYEAADPFFTEKKKNVQIARFYGINPSDMTKGSHLCMDCHGTIISGRERRDVQDGVGCESCHGPSKDYLKPHEEGDKSLGEQRPGYIKGLKLGMTELRNQDVRAQTCTNCHYITEPRLISAGHPSGENFNYVAATAKVKHWDHPLASSEDLNQAFRLITTSRGPVPNVPKASFSSPVGISDNLSSQVGRSSTVTRTRTAESSRDRVSSRGSNLGLSPPSSSPPAPIFFTQNQTELRELDLPPFPEIDESTSIEEVLLLIKNRLELLHQTLYQEP